MKPVRKFMKRVLEHRYHRTLVLLESQLEKKAWEEAFGERGETSFFFHTPETLGAAFARKESFLPLEEDVFLYQLWHRSYGTPLGLSLGKLFRELEQEDTFPSLNSMNLYGNVAEVFRDYVKFLKERGGAQKGESLKEGMENASFEDWDGILILPTLQVSGLRKKLLKILWSKSLPIKVLHKGKVNPPVTFEELLSSLSDNREDSTPKKMVTYGGFSQRDEMKEIFRYIKRNIKQGWAPEDHRIILRHQQTMALFTEMAKREGIPLNNAVSHYYGSLTMGREYLTLLDFLRSTEVSTFLKRIPLTYFPLEGGSGKVPSLLEEFSGKTLEEAYDSLYHMVSGDVTDEEYSLALTLLREGEKERQEYARDPKTFLIEVFHRYEVPQRLLQRLKNGGEIGEFRKNLQVMNAIGEVFLLFEREPFFPYQEEEFPQFLRNYLKTTRIRRQKGHGIHIFGTEESMGLEFPFTIFAEMGNREPEVKKSHFLLEERGREAWGFEVSELSLEYQRNMNHLKILLSGTEEGAFFTYTREWPRDRGSLLLEEFPLSSYEPLKNYGDTTTEEEAGEYLRTYGHSWPKEEPLKDPFPLRTSFETQEIPPFLFSRQLAVTDLETYGKCPFSFYGKKVLGLKDRGPGREIMDRGIFFHRVLENYVERKKDSYGQFEEELLEELLKREYSLKYNEIETPFLYTYLKEYLGNFLRKDLERLRNISDFIPEKTEVPLSLEFEGWKIFGKADRIDENSKGLSIIIDYKTSEAGIPGPQQIWTGESFQMPLYFLSLEALGETPVACVYGILKTGEFSTVMGLSSYLPKEKRAMSQDDLRDKLEEKKDQLRHVLARIERGDYTPNPKNCPIYCPYRELCRKGEYHET